MDDSLNQAQNDYLFAASTLNKVCEALADKVISPDCIEIPLVQLAAQYAEVANHLHASEPEMYEPFETAIARIQQNIRSEMLRFRGLRKQGRFGQEGRSS
jgi:hypothetical protein